MERSRTHPVVEIGLQDPGVVDEAEAVAFQRAIELVCSTIHCLRLPCDATRELAPYAVVSTVPRKVLGRLVTVVGRVSV